MIKACKSLTFTLNLVLSFMNFILTSFLSDTLSRVSLFCVGKQK